LNPTQVLAWEIPSLTESYTASDALAYAWGVGVIDRGDELLVQDSAGVSPLPSFAATLNQGPMWTQSPELGLDWQKTVHIAERLIIYQALKPSDTLTAHYKIDAVYDLGAERGAEIHETRSLFDQHGAAVADVKIISRLLGDGGFGGEAPPKVARIDVFKNADIRYAVSAPANNERAIYKLPKEFIVGELPLGRWPLRGVCSFGVACRAIVQSGCAGEIERLLELSLRYKGAIYTDDVLILEAWWLTDERLEFVLRSQETGKVVLDAGTARIRPPRELK
jgi:hypothetical protein